MPEAGRIALRDVHADPGQNPFDLAALRDRGNLLRELVGTLPRRHRCLLLLRYVEDWTFADIAAKLQISEASAWKAHERILRKLRETMAAKGIDGRSKI